MEGIIDQDVSFTAHRVFDGDFDRAWQMLRCDHGDAVIADLGQILGRNGVESDAADYRLWFECHRHRNIRFRGGAVAEPAIAVVSPCFSVPIRADSQGVVVTCAYLRGVKPGSVCACGLCGC